MKTNEIEAAEWAWYASRDEEAYDCGPEKSREAIIQAATWDFDGERFHILEGRQGPVDVAAYLNVEAVVEQIGEALYEDVGDPDGETVLLDPSRVATDALDGMLKAEIRRWQELHGIKVMSWPFTEIRNAEFIEPSDQALERAGGGE
ncbi:hypothetical protein [Antarcticirhabdus aurantiaca]|uniref:Uncharacterized protein n=1 Tax=Antarcticirhabdus aurantiaca TaxID=2606717 RepID=A0ACD4NLE0_9HYPH|nr:hypothetical protein OXU80_22505 [Jeongeuplla avenae]